MADDDIIAATRTPLGEILARVPAEAAAAAAGPSVSLPFVMQRQLQDQWCWAAVAASVSDHYTTPSSWTQCRLADAELGQATCCDIGASGVCNQPWYLDRVLTRTNSLVSWASGTIAFDDVVSEIESGRLVGVRIGWAGGGGHFVVLAGYQRDPGGDTIAVFDPWPGTGDTLAHDWGTFASQYQGSGSWTHTYHTSS